jgi:ABC-type nitrate/sulfonate/bicarbonate transport system substrate-binding protein
MLSRRTKLLSNLLVFAIGTLLIQPAFSATRELERVRIGYSVGGLIPLPVVLARETKLFEQAGLDVELINIPPTIGVTALISGDIQYVAFVGTAVNAAVRGLPIRTVLVHNDRPLFSLMSKPEIRSLKDLKGKVLGVATLTSGESLLTRRLLKDAGVDADKDMILRVIGNTPERLMALRSGIVDATTLTVPVDIQAEKSGLRRLAFMGELLESLSGGLSVSERWIQQRPDQIKKVVTATLRAMDNARARRADAVGLIAARWKIERDVADKAFDLVLKTWSDNGLVTEQAVQAGIDESLRLAASKQQVPISRVVDFSFAREANRELKAK